MFDQNYQYGESYWNNKYPSSPVIYSGRSPRVKADSFGIDVTEFLTTHDVILKQIVNDYNLVKSTANDTALAVQRWVVSFLTYVDDSKGKGTPECWQFPFETVQQGIGDCEDGAILTANLLINAGIPTWRVKVAAGYVQEAPTAPQGGHAYCLYLADVPTDEKKLAWKILDWCIVDNRRTIIQTPNGGKRISELKEGDWVIGYDEKNQKPALTQIKKLGNRQAKNVYKITFENGEPIYATGEHPFYVKGQWKRADELEVGDEPYYIKPKSLYHMMHEPQDNKEINQFVMNGNKITKIELASEVNKQMKNKDYTVWNMHCSPHNNYFVNGNLVHNCYYEDSALTMDRKPLAKNGGYNGCYKDVWFTFNSDFAWAAEEVTIPDGRISQGQTTLKESVIRTNNSTLSTIMSNIFRRIKNKK